MARILVAGGVDEDGEGGKIRAQFAEALGRTIVRRGHILLGGCRTKLDAIVARAAALAADAKGSNRESVIRSWITDGTTPTHAFGKRIRSQIGNWGQIPRGYAFPEPVRDADAVIIVGGWEGTQYAASWARLANKPLLPVATFGGAASDIFNDEIKNDRSRRSGNLTDEDFELLNSFPPTDIATLDAFSERVVSLAEHAALSKEVFIVMSFEQKPELIDAFRTFERVCEKRQLKAVKSDNHIDAKQNIVPAIFSHIKSSAFVIAELSAARPNVYYEIGFARALGKAVIHTAREGTTLLFDVFDVPTLFYEGQTSLATELDDAIGRLFNP